MKVKMKMGKGMVKGVLKMREGTMKVMLTNVQVTEWEKVAEDWIRAGRKLMLLHYEEVANVLSNIEF